MKTNTTLTFFRWTKQGEYEYKYMWNYKKGECKQEYEHLEYEY